MSSKPTKTFLAWCKENGADELLRLYEDGKNSYSADQIGFSSSFKVNFHCRKCGYSWERSLNKATAVGAKLDCPVCNGRIYWGDNHWTKKYPELVEQWDYENNDKDPGNCALSNDLIYWRCKRCRNQWKARIKDRIRSAERVRSKGGELCPFCGNQKISPQYNLAVCHPDIAKQLDYIKNEGLRAEDCFPAGNQKVWWRCSFNPSHTWQDVIANRTVLRRGCPYCSRMFKTTYTTRVLFYYLRQVFPDCACEYPEERYHLDLCIPSYGIAI